MSELSQFSRQSTGPVFSSSFVFFGERKGTLTGVLANQVDEGRRTSLEDQVAVIARDTGDGDLWSTWLVKRGEKGPASIVSDTPERVETYLANLAMLWQLGLKDSPRDLTPKVPMVVVHAWRRWDPESGDMRVAPTKRTEEDIAGLNGEIVSGTAETIALAKLDDQGRYNAGGP